MSVPGRGRVSPLGGGITLACRGRRRLRRTVAGPPGGCCRVSAGDGAAGHGSWPAAGLAAAAWAYAALVFVALSASGLHRLRICLRVADQAGRIIAAAALPAVALLPWLTGRAGVPARGHGRGRC